MAPALSKTGVNSPAVAKPHGIIETVKRMTSRRFESLVAFPWCIIFGLVEFLRARIN